jgi:two-component system, OmpR family, sensor kinase
MSRIPMRIQVATAFAVAMAVVLTAMGIYVYKHLGTELSRSLDGQLQTRANDLTVDITQAPSVFDEHITTDFGEPGDQYAQLIDTRSMQVLQRTRDIGAAPLLSAAELRKAAAAPFFQTRPRVPGLPERSRLLARVVDRPSGSYVLVVGAATQDREAALASLLHELLVLGPVALVLATVAGYVLAGYALRPVEMMRRRAAEISAETPGERLPAPATNDELERLGTTLNEMLDRLEAALQRERDFVADAGHELRTPLALLRAELELALRHSGTVEELRDAIRASSGEADRLAQLAEDLLLIARSDRGQIPLRREPIDSAALLGSVERRFEWRAEAAGRPLLVEQADGLVVVGDRIRLEQALGNLVDNALRHGDGVVHLAAEPDNGGVRLSVRDEGPGFPDDFVAHAFDRFSRADAARQRGGVGLGLSIVESIAVAHGGAAGAGNAPGGGGEVWMTLPGGGNGDHAPVRPH